MKSSLHLSVLLIGCMCLTGLTSAAQQSLTATGGATASGVVPNLIKYSSVLKDGSGAAITALSGVTFLIYKDEQGGAPLWMETQNVQPDKAGRYTVQLGAVSKDGLPSDVFMTGEARWLAVQIGNQAEQARVALVAVPYAMKAADAQTLGGLPASAFMLAAPSNGNTAAPSAPSEPGSSTTAAPPSSSTVTTTGGTANTIPLFTTATNIQNSILTQTGTSAVNVGGKLNLPATGMATSSKGFNSQPGDFVASVFNSGTSTAVPQTFQWQAEPVNNNTTTASGALNLLFGQGTSVPTETGFKISSKGVLSFASGQTFPGTGTITRLNSGAGLTGGPITTTGTLSIPTAGVTNAMLANPALKINAGTDLLGGGLVSLGGSTTLNLDTTKVPQLATANTFTGNQTVNGNLSATGLVTGSGYQIGSNLFDFGSYASQNGFLGFAGNTTTTGSTNTASGFDALHSNTTGSYNTANGAFALYFNTTGAGNTASGEAALDSNTTGSGNVAVGQSALFSNKTGSSLACIGLNCDVAADGLTNATAVGAHAEVGASNALVLGSINGVNGATASTNVGIGTTTPAATLDVHGTGNFTGLITFAAGQTFPGTGTITGVTGGTDLTGGGSSGNVTLNVDPTKVVTGVVAGTDLTGGGTGGVQTLNLDTTKVPQLATANTFTGSQTVNGNLSATGVVTGSGYQIGSNLFNFGSYLSANAFLGFAGNTTTTGFENTASGYQALYSNTTGIGNTASGYQALQSNTTGVGNTASGEVVLYSNTTGSYNTASGAAALNFNTMGSFNTASGYQALYSNTTGGDNTASGYHALVSNTTGSGNVAVGESALVSNNTGSSLACIGLNCNVAADGLTNATAVGAQAEVGASNALVLGSINGVNNATANTSVGIGTTTPGTQSGITIPNTSLDISLGNEVIRGSNNFHNAGDTATLYLGDGNNFIQATAGGGLSLVAFQAPSNALTVVNGGHVGVWTAAPSNVFTVAQGAGHALADGWDTYSSRRWKTHIETLHGALDKVEQLRGVSYDLKGTGNHEIGVIAEEVGAVVPEVVSWDKDGTDAKGVDYGRLTALLIEATKEQQALIRKQQEQIRVQQAQIARLTSQVRAIQTSLNTNDRTGPGVRPVKVEMSVAKQ